MKYLIKQIKTQDRGGEFFIPNKYLGKDNFFLSPAEEDPVPPSSDPHTIDLTFKWLNLYEEKEINPLKKYRNEHHKNGDTRLAKTPRITPEGDPIAVIEKISSLEYSAKIYKKGDRDYDAIVKTLGGKSYLLTDKIKYTIDNKLNQILFGPPGTGKTYSTITRALDIIGLEYNSYEEAQELFQNELGKRLEFVTMHQSFSYEDFVQGLKPKKSEDGSGIVFEHKNGVFKEICRRAELQYKKYKDYESKTARIDFDVVFDFAFKSLIDNDEPVEIENGKSPFKIYKYNDKTLWFETSKETRHPRYTIALKTLKEIYNVNENKIITSGNKGYFDSLLIFLNAKSIEMQTEFKAKLKLEDNKNFVIILDEINRANISRVFGELIALIEKDKRDGKLSATLPSGERFTVPSNLYIIGTMNTADKSIALVDVALRRRFEFIPLYPDTAILEKVLKEKGFSTEDIALRVHILSSLNRIIRAKKSVDFEIGHSYFMEDDDLVNIINKQILPLLNEYFMYDLRKVRDIIEKTQKDKEGRPIPKTGIVFNKDIWEERGLLKVSSITSLSAKSEQGEIDFTAVES